MIFKIPILHAIASLLGGHLTFVQFIDSKWGDIVALSILITGLATMKYNQAIGMTLIGSGLTGLKLRSSPIPINGVKT